MPSRKKAQTPKVGEWAFLVGLLLAIVLGFFDQASWGQTVTAVLVVLGIIVGLVNIVAKETDDFLIASIALLVAGVAGYGGVTGYGLYQVLPGIGSFLSTVLTNIATFVAPAAVIVAIKAVYRLARK